MGAITRHILYAPPSLGVSLVALLVCTTVIKCMRGATPGC